MSVHCIKNGCQSRLHVLAASRCPRLSKRQRLRWAPVRSTPSADSDELCPHGRVGFRAPRCACRHPRAQSGPPIRPPGASGQTGQSPAPGAAGPGPRREGSWKPRLPASARRWLARDPVAGDAPGRGTTVLRAQIFPPGPTHPRGREGRSPSPTDAADTSESDAAALRIRVPRPSAPGATCRQLGARAGVRDGGAGPWRVGSPGGGRL